MEGGDNCQSVASPRAKHLAGVVRLPFAVLDDQIGGVRVRQIEADHLVVREDEVVRRVGHAPRGKPDYSEGEWADEKVSKAPLKSAVHRSLGALADSCGRPGCGSRRRITSP